MDEHTAPTESKLELFEHPPVVINIGVKDFADALENQGVKVIRVDWSPPAGGDQKMIDLLDKLM